jgi:predicted RNase H-like HicB family nuclease
MRRRGEPHRAILMFMSSIKIIVERHEDGYVAYPVGMRGIVVGEGDSYDDAVADVRSAIKFHVETFGSGVLAEDSPVLEAFVAETEVTV